MTHDAKPMDVCVQLRSMGQRRRAPGDLAGMLLECHERIRRFVALARAAGERRDLPDDHVVAACRRVERYFTEAFPLHVRDEEDSVLPRLRACPPAVESAVDSALETMLAQHARHQPLLRALLDATAAVCDDPRDGTRRATLEAAASELGRELEEHLALEELVIIPAIRALPESLQRQIGEELRARRAR